MGERLGLLTDEMAKEEVGRLGRYLRRESGFRSILEGCFPNAVVHGKHGRFRCILRLISWPNAPGISIKI